MKYAVKRSNGDFTGVVYDQLKPSITAHHAQYGEVLVPVAALTNTGTEDDPVWEAVESSPEVLRAAIDRHVEDQAHALEYNSAAHLAGYATSTVTEWQAEAQAFVAWRDSVWQAAIAMLADAEASGEVPSVEDVIAALPKWPDA